MSRTALEKIALKMKELSDLQEQIEKMINNYNELSNESDNDTRLALIVATNHKYDYFPDREDSSFDSEQPMDAVTHNEYVDKNGRPNMSIVRTHSARAWFPSSIC